jgi:hypothetical protein
MDSSMTFDEKCLRSEKNRAQGLEKQREEKSALLVEESRSAGKDCPSPKKRRCFQDFQFLWRFVQNSDRVPTFLNNTYVHDLMI